MAVSIKSLPFRNSTLRTQDSKPKVYLRPFVVNKSVKSVLIRVYNFVLFVPFRGDSLILTIFFVAWCLCGKEKIRAHALRARFGHIA
jgi:hypothetical protein